jgi:uncharacterized protein YaeQ
MARPSTIFRVNIQLSDIDRGIYEAIQVTAAQHPSETEERLVARLLAMAIYYEQDLSFTKGISATEEPDIWVVGPDGRVQLWVEVGLPEADRIIKASRHSGQVALLACGKTLSSWDQQHLPKLGAIKNLKIITVDQSFITTLASRLERSVSWSITITEGLLYLTCGDVTYETVMQIKAGASR